MERHREAFNKSMKRSYVDDSLSQQEIDYTINKRTKVDPQYESPTFGGNEFTTYASADGFVSDFTEVNETDFPKIDVESDYDGDKSESNTDESDYEEDESNTDESYYEESNNDDSDDQG